MSDEEVDEREGSEVHSDEGISSGNKRLRSTKEYREKKKMQKRGTMNPPISSVSSGAEASEDFVRLVKDNVAKICFQKIGHYETKDPDEVPEWRVLTRRISQTLLEKESRMPEDIRFNMSTDQLRENAIKRVSVYTSEYLKRKYSSS